LNTLFQHLYRFNPRNKWFNFLSLFNSTP